MSVNDRRQAERAPALVSIQFRTDEAAGNCTATDISETGMFLFMMTRPPIGSEIYLVFKLPGFDNLPPLEIKGKVARIVDKGEGPTQGVGVEFSNIYSESKETIRSFVSSVLDPESSPPLDTDPPSHEYRIKAGKLEPVIPKEAATPPPPVSQAPVSGLKAAHTAPPPVPADTRPAPKGWVPLTDEEIEEMSREIPVDREGKKAKPSSSMGRLKAASSASKGAKAGEKDLYAQKDILAASHPPSAPPGPMGQVQERKDRHYKLSYKPDSKKGPRVKRAGRKKDKAVSKKFDDVGILARFNLTPAKIVMILFLLGFVSFVIYIIIKNVSWCMKLTGA